MPEEKEGKTIKIKIPSMSKIDIWRILTIVFAAIILAQLFGLFNITGFLSLSSPSGEQAAQKAVEWINNYFKSRGQDVTATLVSVEGMESGVYKFTVRLSSPQGSSEETYYVSTDGKLFFPNGISTEITTTSQTTQTQQPRQEVPKTDKPEARVFVMSYCPYGLQFLKAFIPVMELLGNKADLHVNFVDYIMHGEKEMIENTRMYCIQKEQKDKFTSYLRCFVQSGDAEKCIGEAKINKTKLDACMEFTDKQYNLTALFKESKATFPPYPIDSELNDRYGVRGSPTFVLNGVTISVNRAAESIKQAICSAFKVQPVECSQTLSTTTESPGIGPIGSGSAASSGGQC